jgi:hypothetical protein
MGLGIVSNEIKLPDYPAMAACLVIESRLVLRNELEKDIKSTALFDEVKIAKSLSIARMSLEMEEIDCCILGSSVSSQACRDLLGWAPGAARSKDCAYLVISDKNSKEIYIHDGAHGQTWQPLSKAKLFDAIVRAVVSANKNSAWRGIFEKSEFHRGFDNSTNNPLLIGAARSSVQSSALEKPWETIGLIDVESLDEEGIKKLFVKRNFVFFASGDCTSELKSAAETMLKSILGGSVENPRFEQYCRKAVYTWFEDAPLGGFKEATEQLRMRILQFRG